MAASLQPAANLMPSTKIGASARTSLQLQPVQNVGKTFGIDTASARVTCSLLKDTAKKCTNAAKIAGFALATSAIVISLCIHLA